MKRGLLSWLLHKKGSLNTNFNSERNYADVSTRCSSLLQGIGIQRAFLSEEYCRAIEMSQNWQELFIL